MITREQVDADILLQGIQKMCTALFYVDVQTHDAILYVGNEVLKKAVDDTKTYQGVLDSATRWVAPAYRNDFAKFMDITTLDERIEGRNMLAYEYENLIYGWSCAKVYVVDYDNNHKLHHVFLSIARINEEMELRHRANCDPLTGLLNHRSAANIIRKKIESHTPGVLMLIDCDKFKMINDRCGHYVGDNCIIQLSAAIKKTFPFATCFRMGGDEFGIFQEGIYTAKAVQILFEDLLHNSNHIKNRINEIAKEKLPIFLSAGALQYQGEEHDYYDLFILADKCLYESKIEIGNKLTFVKNLSQTPELKEAKELHKKLLKNGFAREHID